CARNYYGSSPYAMDYW
nr:immunoglobulin heavy chain junction region [Mus musculus]MBK4185349.1 immunoglobulin heavy chain junction region [Mus musculus]